MPREDLGQDPEVTSLKIERAALQRGWASAVWLAQHVLLQKPLGRTGPMMASGCYLIVLCLVFPSSFGREPLS